MKKMTFALACASTAALFADLSNTIGFEGYTVPFTGLSGMTDAGVDNGPTSSFWLSGTADNSAVKAYGGDNLTAPTTGDDPGSNYLELSTEGDTLWRSVNNLTDADSLGAAQAVSAGGLFIDTMVQFTATEDGAEPSLGTDDKLAIWLNVDKDGVTNLCVRALQAKNEFSENGPQTFVLNNAAGNLTINAGEWYRLKVKANPLMGVMSAYEIFIGDDQLQAVGDELPWDASSAALFTESPLKSQIAANQLFVSLLGQNEGAATLSAVGFKGSGAIDNLTIADTDPNPPAPIDTIPFTIAVADGMTAAWSADGGETWTDYEEGAEAPAGTESIMVKLTNAYGISKTTTATIGEENDFDYTETELFNKVTPTVTLTGATATIKVGGADYAAETAYEEGAVITVADVAAIDGYKEAAATVSINGAEAIAFPTDGVTIADDTTSIAITVTATQMDTYTVTAAAELNANVETVTATPASFREDAASKETTLTATFAEGYELDYFTVDGVQIEGNTVTVTKSITINAVAKQTVVPVTSVTLDITSTNVTVDTVFALVATVAPENATSKTVTWEVTDGDAVTVDNGTVTAVKVGTATVTATAGEQSATCTITVEAAGKVYPSYVDADKQEAYDTWADTYKVADRTDSEAALKDAFLLNCDPANVDAAKAAFKITKVEIDAEGNVTVTPADGADYGNGTIEIQGATTLEGPWAKDTEGAKFFKAILK